MLGEWAVGEAPVSTSRVGESPPPVPVEPTFRPPALVGRSERPGITGRSALPTLQAEGNPD